MDEMVQRVENYIVRHDLFSPEARLLVAVSGGVDSVVLLHVLTRLAPAWRLRLHVLHVNHRLRADAARDGQFVANLAEQADVPATVVNVDVRAKRRGGESVQQAARRLRLRALRRAADDVGASRIALGHHADDQAETVLFRLLRGTGTTGLGGMRPRRGPFIRPLLDVLKEELEAYRAKHHLHIVDDPSNRSDAYARNRLRLRLLPQLAAEYNPNIVRRLADTARLLQQDDAVLQRLAAERFELACGAAQIGEGDEAGESTSGPDGGNGAIELSVRILKGEPDGLRGRIMREALQRCGADLRNVTYEHTEAIVALLESSGAVTVPGPVSVRREDDVLSFRRGSGEDRNDVSSGQTGAGVATGLTDDVVIVRPPLSSAVRLNIPGRTRLNGDTIVDATFMPREAFGDDTMPRMIEAWFDWSKLKPPVVVRHRRPGDRMRPLGLGGTKKVQDLFVDEKIPRHLRDHVVIVEDGAGIIWIPGVRTDERPAVGHGIGRVLHVQIRSL